MDSSALVVKTVTEGGRPVGAIGIIGPKRMDYRRVISVLDRPLRGDRRDNVGRFAAGTAVTGKVIHDGRKR